jgi:hypothetical protein
MKNIKGKFVSEWDSGEIISTPCELDKTSGELFPEIVDINIKGSLEREYFQTPTGDEFPVCDSCHSYVLKTVMNPGIGHDLNEELECPDPDCASHD